MTPFMGSRECVLLSETQSHPTADGIVNLDFRQVKTLGRIQGLTQIALKLQEFSNGDFARHPCCWTIRPRCADFDTDRRLHQPDKPLFQDAVAEGLTAPQLLVTSRFNRFGCVMQGLPPGDHQMIQTLANRPGSSSGLPRQLYIR